MQFAENFFLDPSSRIPAGSHHLYQLKLSQPILLT
jgi:hypothetical protein